MSVVFPQYPNISQHFTSEFVGEDHLTPEEAVIVANAAGKRKIDFSTGRYCARIALANLIAGKVSIIVGDKRQPIWPPGIVGSISHSSKLVGAVVAPNSLFLGIGLDI